MMSENLDIEIVVAIIAIAFFFVGIYINKKSLHKPVQPSNSIDHQKIKELAISAREYEVLQ